MIENAKGHIVIGPIGFIIIIIVIIIIILGLGLHLLA